MLRCPSFTFIKLCATCDVSAAVCTSIMFWNQTHQFLRGQNSLRSGSVIEKQKWTCSPAAQNRLQQYLSPRHDLMGIRLSPCACLPPDLSPGGCDANVTRKYRPHLGPTIRNAMTRTAMSRMEILISLEESWVGWSWTDIVVTMHEGYTDTHRQGMTWLWKLLPTAFRWQHCSIGRLSNLWVGGEAKLSNLIVPSSQCAMCNEQWLQCATCQSLVQKCCGR